MSERRSMEHTLNRRSFLVLGGVTVAALTGISAEMPVSHATKEIPLAPPNPETSIGLAEQLRSRWQETIKNRRGSIDIAMVDNLTGLYAQVSNDGATHNTASIVKLAILERLLMVDPNYARQHADYIRPMITVSDNEIARDLWEKVGGQSSMQTFFHDVLGTSQTSAGVGPFGTMTTASDQLKVVNAAIFPGALRPEDTAFATDMLRQVVPGQRWGISAGLPPDVMYENKNGWVDARQNSIGRVHGKGVDYSLAVLVDYGGGAGYDRETIEMLATDTWQLMSQAH